MPVVRTFNTRSDSIPLAPQMNAATYSVVEVEVEVVEDEEVLVVVELLVDVDVPVRVR